MVAKRKKRAPVDSGPSAEDLQYGRLGVMYGLCDGDPEVFERVRDHDHAEPFADAALEAEAREFAERHRHMWQHW